MSRGPGKRGMVRLDADWGWSCAKCGHQWVPRDDPKRVPGCCAKCKNPSWNKRGSIR